MKKSIFAFALATLGAVGAQAAVSHSLAIAAVYTSTGTLLQTNPTAAQLASDYAQPAGTTDYYAVTVSVSGSNYPSGSAFGDESYGLALSGGLGRPSASVGSKVRVPFLVTNAADGFDNNGAAVSTLNSGNSGEQGPNKPNGTDNVVIQINNDANSYNNVFNDSDDDASQPDTRPTYGNPGPTVEGTLYVSYATGASGGYVTLNTNQYAYLDTNPSDPTYMQFGLTNLNLDGAVTGPTGAPADTNLGSAALYIGPVPEPTTLSLLGLGAMGLIARRRKA